MAYSYSVLDVFTDRPLAGNPLAVVRDAVGLDDSRMQAIAREFGLPETVFVLPATNPVHSARIRIFTPQVELPFAGHPTVGTAFLLARAKIAGAGPGRHEVVLVLEENVGPVRCGVFVTGGPSGHAVFDAPRLPEAVDAVQDSGRIAAALGLMPSEIGFENHRPSIFTAGIPYAFIPVCDLAVIARAHANLGAWDAAFGPQARAAYLYCRQTEVAGRQFHARMFAPAIGIAEDPATGSAAAAFPGVVHRFDQPQSGNFRYAVEQGFEMGRPSLMGLEVDIANGAIVATRVSGDAVVVAEGTLDV